jgi:hypothetical protein
MGWGAMTMKRRKLGVLMTLVAVTACAKAEVGKANSSNPAHCIAAFNWGRSLELRAEPNIHGALGSTAREVYYALKLKNAGVRDGGQAESTAFTMQYGANRDVMLSLLKDCAYKQDADPAYKAMNDDGRLMAMARKADPICKADAECTAGKKW